MFYYLVDAESVNPFRQCKDVIAVNGCMVGHLLIYEQNSKNILIREYRCDCKNCLLLEFQNCFNISESESNDNVECEENAWFGDDESNENNYSQVFEFLDVPSFVALMSCSSIKPEKKGKNERMLRDCYEHTALDGDMFSYGKIPTKGHIKENKEKTVQNFRKRRLCNARRNI